MRIEKRGRIKAKKSIPCNCSIQLHIHLKPTIKKIKQNKFQIGKKKEITVKITRKTSKYMAETAKKSVLWQGRNNLCSPSYSLIHIIDWFGPTRNIHCMQFQIGASKSYLPIVISLRNKLEINYGTPRITTHTKV